MKILVTGAAGFIGMHVCQRLLERGDTVFGIDDLNDYYDPALKRARLARLEKHAAFSFGHLNVADRAGHGRSVRKASASAVIHLAAQAGVRYSLQNPAAYIDSNLVGIRQHPRRLPPPRREAPRVRQQFQRVRRQQGHAVQRAPERRSPGQPLCRHEEGQRADGAQLQPPVPAADHRTALLHGVWPLGPAGHGVVPVHQGDAGRASRSTSSTTAKCCATSPTSTISWRESSA